MKKIYKPGVSGLKAQKVLEALDREVK